MATLKSIKNKYLTASDGTVLGVTTNTENISALSFKLATADSLSKFNLVDGFADDYNDATGVDASASTDASRDSTGKYYFGGAAGVATGGTVTTYGSYTVHTFTASSAFVTPSAGTVDVLVVGNGGSGGTEGSRRGGGGGGGVIYGSDLDVDSGSRTITFSSAGAGGGGGGSNTIVLTSTATLSGGGGGGASNGVPGGGSSSPSPTGGATGYTSGGGGNGSSGSGAGSPGGNGPANDYQTGVSQNYGGGGGGGHHHDDSQGAAPGGAGGGGDGGGAGTDGAKAGTAPFGGGGGGAGAAGAMGIVVVRYLDGAFLSIDDMDLRSNTFTAQTEPTTARIIMDEWDYTGATTLGTDLKAYASRDNGTTFTQITLADQGFLLGDGGINGDTKLMLHCDGTNGGTTFTDSSPVPQTVTAVGNANTSTAQFKFGTASGYFDGTGDYLTLPVSDDWNFGTGDFTIDGWIRTDTSPPTYGAIFDSRDATSTATGFAFAVGSGGDIYIYSNGMLVQSSNSTITAETWHHVALVRASGTTNIYVDGVSVGSNAASRTYSNTTARIGIEAFGTSEAFKGYIDEFRITKGVAVWTATFTPPTQEYQTSRRLLSGSVDISGQPAGTNMKYKLTSHNQATTKETRVYGTSMAWA